MFSHEKMLNSRQQKLREDNIRQGLTPTGDQDITWAPQILCLDPKNVGGFYMGLMHTDSRDCKMFNPDPLPK